MSKRSTSTVLEMDSQASDEKTEIYKVDRSDTVIEKSTGSYQGCYYTVGMKVDRPVKLTGLEFFGPAKDTFVDIKAKIWIYREKEVWDFLNCFGYFGTGPMYKIKDLVSPYTVNLINAKGCENFTVELVQPLELHPEQWIDIKFELVGPETECSKNPYSRGTRTVTLKDGSKVSFEFLAGARQLPALLFTL